MADNRSALPTSDGALLLQGVDAEFARSMTAVYVYVAMVMVTGLLGNFMVCLVYVTKFKATTTRSFILAMAVLDLVSCAVGMPLDFVDVSRSYTFPSDGLCKVKAAAFSFNYICSAFLLLLVAADRYRKICHPLASQLGVPSANRAIIGCGLISTVFAWPQLLLSGNRQEEIENVNATATRCSRENSFDGTKYPLIYNAVLVFLFLGGSFVLVTLYSLIISVIRKRRPKGGSFRPSKPDLTSRTTISSCSSDVTCEVPISETREPSDSMQHQMEQSSTPETLDEVALTDLSQTSVSIESCDVTFHSQGRGAGPENGEERSTSNAWRSSSECDRVTSTSDTNIEIKDLNIPNVNDSEENKPVTSAQTGKIPTASMGATGNTNQLRKAKHEAIVQKTTFTLFLVTLVYVLSFLPFLVIRVLRALEVVDEDGQAKAVVGLCMRSLYFQSAANPLIYGIRHPEFREKCRRLLSGLK